jgi:acetyltransferase-like isoleucine patch superfamily enzyme
MSNRSEGPPRIVEAVHGRKETPPDPEFEVGLSHFLKAQYSPAYLLDLYDRFSTGDDAFARLMRRTIWRASTRRFGNGVSIHGGVGFKHIETFEIGNGVFIGAQSFIQGRFDGTCVIGDNVWIGPQSYFDARDLVIEEYVGWGPGAKLLGSTHTGIPVDLPIVQTDLLIRRVTIGAWADIGTNAVILPGVTVGRGGIVGAGSVVTKDVAPFSIVAGVPATFIKWREGYKKEET